MNEIIALKQADGSFLIGIEMDADVEINILSDLELIDDFIQSHANDFIFTVISYQLGFPILGLQSTILEKRFPLLKAFTCKNVYVFNEFGIQQVKGENHPNAEDEIKQLFEKQKEIPTNLVFEPRISKSDYLEKIGVIKNQLQLGNIYEINFCQSFQASYKNLDSKAIFSHLQANNPTPHAAYIDFPSWSLVSASPERFIKKVGNRLSSDPIKGTAKRGATVEEDERLKEALRMSQKERAENVMIVDLVRNDLSKIANKGSVKVNELFGIYSYPTVHQMISKISCTIPDKTLFSTQLKALFPMGSMTGAPKRAAVEIAQNLEDFNRELYSGSVGVILPNGDYDFNVLIRSFVIDKIEQTISCAVGGAITILSDAEAEYEECRTKIGKIISLFGTCRWS